MKVNISTNASEKAQRFEAYPAELHSAIGYATYDVADAIFAESQRIVPVDRGTLKNSGNIKYGELSAIVGYNTPYAWYVHEGTGLYGYRHDYIYPRKAKFLSWADRHTGKRIFARKVKGMPARRYLGDAVNLIIPKIPEIFASRIRAAWALIKGGG